MQRRFSDRLASLDFLRGVAILGVIGVHTIQAFPSEVPQLDGIVGMGRFGVQLFFYVSAYTLCLMWLKRQGETAATRKFFVRRWLRIAPLFWLAGCFYFALSLRNPRDHLNELLLSATFLHGFSPTAVQSIVPGGWSIAVEMTFYALFPWLITIFAEKHRIYLVSGLATWLLYTFSLRPQILAYALAHTGNNDIAGAREFAYLFFLNQAPVFLLGCYVFWLVHSRSRPSLAEIVVLASWLLASLTQALITNDGHFGFAATYLSIGMACFLSIRSALHWTPLDLLGRHSYSIYLVHFFVISQLERLLPGSSGLGWLLAAIVLTILSSLLVALALHQLIETPIAALARHWTR